MAANVRHSLTIFTEHRRSRRIPVEKDCIIASTSRWH